MEFENRFDGDQVDVVDQTEETHEDGGQAGVVDQQETEDQKQAQTRAENAALKAARLQGSREAEARLRAQFDREIEESGAVNPETGKPFKSFQEFQAYGKKYQEELLEEQAEKTGRPIEELREEAANRAYISKQRKEAEAKKGQSSKQAEEQQRLIEDAMEFQRRHPNVDITELEKNPKFRKFAGNRLYKDSISDLYDDYLELVSDAQETGRAQAGSKASRGTGGGTGGETVRLTPAQQKELDEWNRENPGMKMTAAEFAAYGG